MEAIALRLEAIASKDISIRLEAIAIGRPLLLVGGHRYWDGGHR